MSPFPFPQRPSRPIEGDRPSRWSLFWQRHKTSLRRTGVLLVVSGTLGGGSWIFYHMLSDTQMGTIRTHLAKIDPLKIKHIIINGTHLTDKKDIINQLNTHIGSTLFGFSVEQARLNINKLPFVDYSTVERHLPDSVIVTVTEHVPIAIWQTHKHFILINEQGNPVSQQTFTDKDTSIFQKLPLVVGNGANVYAGSIITLIKSYPAITAATLALVRIGDRRWNILLRNGATVMLPEGAEEAALQRLNAYQQKFYLFDRSLLAIDMRLPDKMVIRLPSSFQNTAAVSSSMTESDAVSSIPSSSVPLKKASSSTSSTNMSMSVPENSTTHNSSKSSHKTSYSTPLPPPISQVAPVHDPLKEKSITSPRSAFSSR